MRDKGKRKLVITTLLIYCGALLLQDFSAFFETKALEQNVPHINIVAILVDDKIYNSIQDDLERYSTQYIQQEIPDSKALVMPLNLDNIDSPQIYKMLENIYFDGLDGVNSTLLGTVLVGGIPLPVVNQEGYIFPSMYPYVDFVDQKFVRDPVEKYFLPNGNQNGQAEIWHGLVDYGTDITAYHQFFAKLKKYKTNPNSFIGEDIWYEDILANKQGFLEDNLQYYQNKVLFSEDIGYQRFTPLMLQLFQAGQANSMNDITDDLFDSFTELGGSGMSDIMTYTGSDGKVVSTSIKDTLGQSSEKSVSTKTVEKSVKTSFLLDYPSLYSVQNSVILRDNTLAGGRRIKEYTDSDGQKNLQAKADSSIDKINLKDTVNMGSDSLKGILISFNERLENAVDKKIKDEKYDMDIVLPISYETTQAEKVGGCKRVLGIKVCKNKTNKNLDSKYEVFYFGKSANLIQSAQELSIYRGSFRNLTGLNNVLYPLLPSSANNPVKSLQDKTNLQNKSIGASYDIFSTQVEANRGYNLANTQQEYERYEENKSYAKWDLTCAKWRPFSRWKMVCTKIESKPVLSDGKPMEKNDQGECSPYDLANGYAINSKENMRDASCELPGWSGGFTTRRRGGASPLNLDFDLINDGVYQLLSFNGMNALSEIFDIAGSKALTGAQWIANSYKAYKGTEQGGYASPTALQIARKANTVAGQEDTTDNDLKGKFTTINKRLPDEHFTFQQLDFFTIYNNGKDNDDYHDTRKYSTNKPNFELSRQSSRNTGKRKESHTFKVISSIIKNVSISGSQLNGITTTKFWAGSQLTNYYQRISKEIESISGSWLGGSGIQEEIERIGSSLLANLSGINTEIAIIQDLKNANNTGAIPAHITNIQNILEANKFASGDSASLEELYQLLQTVEINSLLNILQTIENTEYETLVINKEKLEFASGWVTEIKAGLTGLQTAYSNTIIKTYQTQYNNIQTLLNNAIININQICGDNSCSTAPLDNLPALTIANNTTITLNTNGIDFDNRTDERISEELKKRIPNTLTSFFHIKDVDVICEDEDHCSDSSIKYEKLTASGFDNQTLIQEIKTKFDTIFQSKNEDEKLIIPGLNLLTPDRPIDSPRYTTFQGVNAQEVRLIYPDLYKVEVYKTSWDIQLLKTLPEIKAGLQTYLRNKVEEYNTILRTAKNSVTTANTSAYNKLKELNFQQATPSLDTTVRKYSDFTYNDLLQALGGESQLDVIAELLYYQNTTNKEKVNKSAVLDDLNATRDSFDFNNKTKYILQEYLTEKNPKLQRTNSWLVIPTYKPLGYEVAYINSNGDDYVSTSTPPSFLTQAQEKGNTFDTENAGKNNNGKKAGGETEAEQEIIQQCNIPVDGSVLLFDISKIGKPIDEVSPRWKAFKCRLEETKKTPMKLTINYAEALGPVIWDQALSGGVRSGLGADLKSYLSEPFKERGEAMKDYGQEREAEYNDIFSSERDQNENNLLQLETQAVLESNSLTEGDTQNPNKDTKKLYQYYTKVKTYVDSNTIDEKHSSITLDLTSNTDLGSMEFIITSTGAGCFQIDGKSLCNGGKRNSRINPNIATTSLKITPTDKKAGISLIQIKICIPGTQDCVTKTQRITTKEGPLDHFKIQSKSPTTPRGMLTSVTITARDANENPIDWANDEFVIQVNEGKFLNDGMYTTEFTTNRFKNLTVYYQAPISGTTTTATMEVVSSSLLGTGKLWTSKQQQIIDAKPLIRLDGKDIITTLGGSANSTIQLKNTDNTTAFQKVDLFIKNPEGQNINIDTEVSIKAKNKLVDIGILEDKNFKKRSTLTLSGGQLSFWYRPTNVAGNEEVSIQIPGLTPFTIKLEIKPAPAQIVEMQISQENIKIWTSTTGTLRVKDVRGNIVPSLTAVKLTRTQNISSNLKDNIIVSSGQATFNIKAEESGIGYMMGDLITNEKTRPGNIRVNITDSLIPTTGLNVLYLNYFGDDRGNQRGYFSENNKYIENLMKSSNKLLATTTQLVDESKVKELLRAIDPDFQVKNYWGVSTTFNLQDNQISLQIGNIATLNTTIDPITRITIATDEDYDKIKESKKVWTNVIFFFPDTENTALPNTFTATLSLYSLSDGTQLWNTPYGDIILYLPKHTINAKSFNLTQTTHQVQTTFSNGSTKTKSTRGIFNTQNTLTLQVGYQSIQDSTIPNNYVGFRGDFKNMTLFAQGERVGEATKKFWSELLINLGDPLLRKYDNNGEVHNTDFDGGFGTEVFSDPDKSIFTTKPIDFNNDGLEDIIIVYTDGSIKLAKNYGYGPNFKNLENLMLIATNIQEVHIGDIDGNGYPDIIIQTTNNQLRAYLNTYGKFDVDGNPFCLNTNVEAGEVSKNPIDTSSVYQIFLEDMDKDNSLDIITNDHKGFVKIFYGGKNGQGTYISKDKATCDTWRYVRQAANTTTVTRFGVKLNEDKVVDNSMAHRYGLEIPSEDIQVDTSNLSDLGINLTPDQLSKLDNLPTDFDTSQLFDLIGMDNFDPNQMASAGADEAVKYQEVSTDTLTSGKKNNVFIPISYLDASKDDNIEVYKTYKDLNEGFLENNDLVNVTVTFKAGKKGFFGAFGDKIQGPRKVALNNNGIPKSLADGLQLYTNNSRNLILHEQDQNFSYLMDNIQIWPNRERSYTYQVTYSDTQIQMISLEDIDGKKYGSGNSITNDGYLDIKLQPTNACIKFIKAFINQIGNTHRLYKSEDINLQKVIDGYLLDIEKQQDENLKNINDTLANIGKNQDMDNIPGFENNEINLQDLLGQAFDGGVNIDLNLFDNELGKAQQELEKVAEGLCRGFSFGGANACEGLPVPFNQAFLAPGDYHILGCIKLPLVPLNKWLPVFHFPGTLTTPVWPIPFPRWMKGPGDGFIRVPGGTYPSMIRIYVAPTLTMQLWVAICLGPYSIGNAIPSPFSELGGNCIVTAINLPCGKKKSQAELDNPDETYDLRINELSNGGTCSKTIKGTISIEKGYASSPFEMITINPNSKDSYGPYIPSGEGLFWIIDLDMDIESVSYASSTTPDSSLTIGGVKIEGGSQIKNKIKSGLKQGLREIIIDKWLDPQIRYIANNFTKMNISLKRPDFGGMGSDIQNTRDTIKTLWTDASSTSKDLREDIKKLPKGVNKESIVNTVKQYDQLSQGMQSLNDQIANPFEQLATMFNKSNLINIQTKRLTVKVPMIYNEDINAYEIYLRQRASTNSEILEERTVRIDSIIGTCFSDKADAVSDWFQQLSTLDERNPANSGTLAQINKNLQEQIKQGKCSVASDIKAQEAIMQAFKEVYKFINEYERMLDQINQNILTLQEYRNFPFELYEWIHVIDRYMAEISALVNNLFGYLSFWMTTNANRFSSYVDAIILVMNVIKTYQLLVDFSVNRSQKCSTCTNDTYDQYSCKLSILCKLFNIELPIIQIPSFKIPNIIIDFSDLNVSLDILLPVFNFQPAKVDLPNIPNLPTPPIVEFNLDLSVLFGKLNLHLPNIPELPGPPHLPELPSFIPNIQLELPLLPPAPKLPEIPSKFEASIKLIEKVWRILCIVKQGIGLVGEGSVKAKIEQLTQRTYEVPYFDRIMDLTNIQAGKPKLNGFDFEISATTNLQFSFSTIYDFLDTVTTSINNLSTKAQYRTQDNLDTVQDNINAVGGLVAQTSEEINYVEYPQAKQRLENALANLTNQVSSDSTTLQQIKTISTTINTPNNIQPNQQDINNIHQQIMSLINEEQNKLLAINVSENKMEESYENFLAILSTQNDLANLWEEKGNLAFNFNLFSVSPETEKLITTAENPYKILLENKAPIIDAFLEEINGNTPAQLNMTAEEYQMNKSNLTNLQHQLAGFYQRIQPAQQTALTTKTDGTATTKQLTAGPTTSPSTANTQSSQIDPSAYINWIFTPTKDKKSLTKVVYSETNTTKIGNQYYLTELNKDNAPDMILRDEHNVYIKYGKQNASFSRQAPKNTKFYTKKVDQLPDEETRLTFDKDTKLKIADTHEEVKNFAIKGQTFDSISFSRRQSQEPSVDGYLLKLTDRIDYSPEKEDTNKNLVETYILILPKGTELTGVQLSFPTPKLTRLITNEIQNRATPTLKEATKNRLIGEIRYFDPNQTTINVIIENIERKWNYAKVATLSETKGILEVNSPRSNQLVAGKQIIGDDQGPEGIASLYRISTKEIVSEWDALDGFVGTHYNLIVDRADNVLLTNMEIKSKGEIIKTVDLQAQSGSISINNLFFTGVQSQQYQFSATDHFGNTTSKDITLNIALPDITITNIEKSTETQAVITAELSQDIDEGNVTFQKNRNNYWTNLISKPNQTENYPLKPKQTEIQGNYYEINDKIALYSKTDQIIAEIDPKTGEITIKDDRKNKVSLKIVTSGNTLLIQVFTTAGELIFNITLPPQELVNVIAPSYTITSINDEYFGMYNKGKAIHKNGENILLIAPNGQIYTEKNLIGTYKYNPSTQSISYILKESALSENTIEIAIKITPFDKD